MKPREGDVDDYVDAEYVSDGKLPSSAMDWQTNKGSGPQDSLDVTIFTVTQMRHAVSPPWTFGFASSATFLIFRGSSAT